MKAELTKLENSLLEKLIKDFETKIIKSKKLTDEQQLILTLSQKSVLSDSDVKKLKLLLEFEQSKIMIRENKKKAKIVLELHENEKKEIIENRYKRFGLVTIEALKKLPNQKATIPLSDFLKLMIGEEDLNKTDKEWLTNFLVEPVNASVNKSANAESSGEKTVVGNDRSQTDNQQIGLMDDKADENLKGSLN